VFFLIGRQEKRIGGNVIRNIIGESSWSTIGRVDENGDVYDDPSWKSVGRVDESDKTADSSASFLLLNEQTYNDVYEKETMHYRQEEYCEEEQNGSRRKSSAMKGASIKAVTLLTIVWAATALLIGGIIYAVEPSSHAFYIPGILLIVSGVFGSVAAALTFARKHYPIAVMACIISAILGLAILIGIFGFFVAKWISRSKSEFME